VLVPESTWGPLRPLTDLDGENSLSTWFSVTQLFVVGAVLMIAAVVNQRSYLLASRALVAAGLVFIALSIDEEAQIHENLTYTAKHFGAHQLPFVGQWNAWIVAYAALGLLATVLAAKHLMALWKHFRPVAVVGGAGALIYVIGAVGFEIASFPFRGSVATRNLQLLAQTIEEFLEMLGVSVILYAALTLTSRVSMAGEADTSHARTSGVARHAADSQRSPDALASAWHRRAAR
jgi:hypothetical protein